MAFNCSSSAAKHLALVVFIFGLLSQYQLEARSTQFFSKVTAPSNFNDSNTDSNDNAAKEQIPQQESSEKGYGLVPDDVSDTAKTNNENYNYMADQTSELDGTTDQGYPTTYNDKAYVTKPQGYKPNNNYGSYEKEQEGQELGATSLLDQDAGHSTTYNNNDSGLNTYNSQQQDFSQEEKDAVLSYNSNNNNYNYNGNQESYNNNVNNNNNNNNYNYNYNGDQEGYNSNVHNNNNNNNFRYNGQQEGMSDTRFLENGRYHYNFKAEDRYSGNANNYNNNNANSYARYNNNNNNNNNANSYAHYNNNNYNNNNNNYNNNNYQVDAENEEFDAFNP